MSDLHPYARRAHLEAILLARVMLDPSLEAFIDRRVLSPAADLLLDAALDDPEVCLGSGLLCRTRPPANDDAKRFCVRLAKRVDQLSLREIGFFSLLALLAFVNSLPRMRGGKAHFTVYEPPELEPRIFA